MYLQRPLQRKPRDFSQSDKENVNANRPVSRNQPKETVKRATTSGQLSQCMGEVSYKQHASQVFTQNFRNVQPVPSQKRVKQEKKVRSTSRGGKERYLFSS